MPLHHGSQHRYGSQMGQQGLPGTHRPGRMGGPGGRPQDPYYEHSTQGSNTVTLKRIDLLTMCYMLTLFCIFYSHRKSER